VLERTAYRDDFGYAESEGRPGVVGRALGSALRHPGRTAVALVIIGAAATIIANAAFFQTGEHPSPFFATNTDDAAPATQAAATEPAAPVEPAANPPADEIGRLVQVTTVATPTVEATAASATVVEVQQLLRAQGYDPGIVDGLFGARTQSAIEAYQTDHGLTVTGEINDALLAQLRSTTPDTTSPNAVLPAEGTQLLAVQTALNQIGYGPITADGQMSDETAAAVRAFQLEYGLDVTGVVDQALIDRMIAIGALTSP
jgi:peptidoglycan hydrolase-like protein with peptidoglycan-binding domain